MQTQGLAPNAPGKNGYKYREQFGVVVICADEAHQQQVYEALKNQNYKLKVVKV